MPICLYRTSISYFALVRRGGSAITSAPLVLCSSNFCSAAEKRYTGITAKVHFYGALPIILRPCKMMGASFAFRKTSLIIFLLRRPWRKLLIGETSPSKSPPQKSPNYSISFLLILCYTPLSYEYGKLKS